MMASTEQSSGNSLIASRTISFLLIGEKMRPAPGGEGCKAGFAAYFTGLITGVPR